ncbi:hypothetical protein AbD4_00634 [Acinetobacter baumannii]|uniref:hypothetical protein n=1 Tax=Acinetobacter baumannii TaxID=470 RepID=UPI0002FBCC85|nr:hypothetical protein [Acinetobacter baumannii]QUX86412.1 hypothetical protein AbD4_00634 [Acinetobacter baumannii]
MPKIKPIKLVIIVVCIAIIAVLAWKFLKPKQQQRKHPANTALPSGPISLNLVPT